MAAAQTATRPSGEDDDAYLPIGKLRQQVEDYWKGKQNEREEAKLARAYYAASQYTPDEVRTLNDRKQPIVVFNRYQRKVNAVVGLMERLRQDPKAYPRTPGGEAGAEIATAVLNYVLDANRWRDISPIVARQGAIEAVAGIELSLEPGDHGDPDLAMHPIDPVSFFYDPRSIREDFSDARYMGISKWFDLDLAQEMFPDKADELERLMSGASDGDLLMEDTNRDLQWTMTSQKKLRLVEHWYKRRGEWQFCFYSGNVMLKRGISPFVDEKKRTFCRFIVYSANIDQDGDRYTFFRNLKGPQDEINHRRSKGLHALNTRQIKVTQGSVQDIDALRSEVHRPDGVLEVPAGADFEVLSNAELVQGNLEMLVEAKNEIENFGPNPALVGQGMGDKSGRAIQLLQQAGIAELGPDILGYRGWKIRVYRAAWNIVQHHWTAERWIRVTDDEGLAQFIKLNGLTIDPMTGLPTIVNALGSLDVDIIVDEGPDSVNLMQDTFDALTKLAASGVQVPPQVIVTMANLPASIKKQVLAFFEQAQQPNPAQQQAAQLELQQKAAEVQRTGAEAEQKRADAAFKLANIDKSRADTRKAHADAASTDADTMIKFMQPVPPPMGVVEQAFQGPGAS